MRIQIPIHPAFLNEKEEVSIIKTDNNGKSGGNLKSSSENIEKNEMLLNSPNNVFNINDVKSDVEKTKMILTEISRKYRISQKSLSEKTGIPYATLQRLMNRLKKDEVIRRVGSAKGGYWEIM